MSDLLATHLRQLDTDLQEHELLLEGLLSRRPATDPVVEAHQLVISLGQNPELRASIAEIAENPDAALLAAADPQAFFAERGVAIPAEMHVEISVDAGRPSIRGVYPHPEFPIILEWSPTRGFTSRIPTTASGSSNQSAVGARSADWKPDQPGQS